MNEEEKAKRLQMIKDSHERVLDKKRLKELEIERKEENGTDYRDSDQYEYQHSISTFDYE